MNNYFITTTPYSVNKRKTSSVINFVNKGLRFLKTGYNIQQIDTNEDMNTIEQRINYYHLLDSLIVNNIEGDVVEFGTFTGQCALLFEKVIEMRNSGKKLHVYDTFGMSFKFKGDVEDKLKENFAKANLKLPVIHKGDFFETVPGQLPDKIAFVHVDCGFGGDPLAHKKVLLHLFEHFYSRMSPGAVCILMDYNDPDANGLAQDLAPGVKMAADEFLADKPEQMISLYGNSYLHGYFRKA